jgi:hypothetical protein
VIPAGRDSLHYLIDNPKRDLPSIGHTELLGGKPAEHLYSSPPKLYAFAGS